MQRKFVPGPVGLTLFVKSQTSPVAQDSLLKQHPSTGESPSIVPTKHPHTFDGLQNVLPRHPWPKTAPPATVLY